MFGLEEISERRDGGCTCREVNSFFVANGYCYKVAAAAPYPPTCERGLNSVGAQEHALALFIVNDLQSGGRPRPVDTGKEPRKA